MRLKHDLEIASELITALKPLCGAIHLGGGGEHDPLINFDLGVEVFECDVDVITLNEKHPSRTLPGYAVAINVGDDFIEISRTVSIREAVRMAAKETLTQKLCDIFDTVGTKRLTEDYARGIE